MRRITDEQFKESGITLTAYDREFLEDVYTNHENEVGAQMQTAWRNPVGALVVQIAVQIADLRYMEEG